MNLSLCGSSTLTYGIKKHPQERMHTDVDNNMLCNENEDEARGKRLFTPHVSFYRVEEF